jgi:hypothetical protein
MLFSIIFVISIIGLLYPLVITLLRYSPIEKKLYSKRSHFFLSEDLGRLECAVGSNSALYGKCCREEHNSD